MEGGEVSDEDKDGHGEETHNPVPMRLRVRKGGDVDGGGGGGDDDDDDNRDPAAAEWADGSRSSCARSDGEDAQLQDDVGEEDCSL